MKVTKAQLMQIIKEELSRTNEVRYEPGRAVSGIEKSMESEDEQKPVPVMLGLATAEIIEKALTRFVRVNSRDPDSLATLQSLVTLREHISCSMTANIELGFVPITLPRFSPPTSKVWPPHGGAKRSKSGSTEPNSR